MIFSKQRWLLLLVFLILGLGLATAPVAGEECATSTVKIEHVALFKNGLSYFSSSVSWDKSATHVLIGQVPIPAYGTFWVGYPDSLKVKSLVTAMETVEEPVPLQGVGQLLELNPGKKVKAFFGASATDFIEGTIVKTQIDQGSRTSPNPYFMDFRANPSYGDRSNPEARRNSNIVMIRTDKGLTAINSGSISRAEIEGGPIATYPVIQEKRPAIRLELDQPASEAKLSLSCLAKGLTWVPNYLLDLTDPQTAKFSAHALLLNEVADLDNVSVDLITGFPNIRFGEILNPIAMSQSMADFLRTLSDGWTSQSGNSRYRDQSLLRQQALVMNNLSAQADSGEMEPMPTYSPVTNGTVSEDLFLYPLKNVTLKKGETAWIPLFTAEMPYKHVYVWKIRDNLDNEDRNQYNAQNQQEKDPEEVWHSCRLTNTLKMPLTTAAAEFTKDGQFVGQDMCFYTAPSAQTTIRINRAMSLQPEQTEFELERKRNAANFYGCSFDLVKVRGDIRLRNLMDKACRIEITKELSGEVLESKPAAKDVATAKGLKRVNPRHTLTWEIDLKPGEEQNLTCQYNVYVRN